MSLEDELDGAIIDDLEKGIFKVHRKVFTDPRIFDLEQERIFNHSWLYVGHEAEIEKAGDFLTRKVAGRTVIVVRSDDMKVRVFLNTCTHRGATVCRESEGRAKFFRCPYHAWTFDTRGSLTAVPLDDAYGPSWNRADHDLKTPAQIDSYRGFIFVSFDKSLEPLVAHLQDAKEYLDFVCDQWEAGVDILAGSHRYSYRAS